MDPCQCSIARCSPRFRAKTAFLRTRRAGDLKAIQHSRAALLRQEAHKPHTPRAGGEHRRVLACPRPKDRMVDVPRPQTNDIWPIWVESGRVGGMTSYRFLASAKGLCVYMTRHTHKIQRALRNACSMQTGAKIALVLACDCHCSAERQETAVKPPQTTYIAWRVLSIFQYCLDNAREPHFPPRQNDTAGDRPSATRDSMEIRRRA